MLSGGRYHIQPAVNWSKPVAFSVFLLYIYICFLTTRYWNCQRCCVKVAATLHVNSPAAYWQHWHYRKGCYFWGLDRIKMLSPPLKTGRWSFSNRKRVKMLVWHLIVPLCHAGTLALVRQREVFNTAGVHHVPLVSHVAIKQEVVVTQAHVVCNQHDQVCDDGSLTRQLPLWQHEHGHRRRITRYCESRGAVLLISASEHLEHSFSPTQKPFWSVLCVFITSQLSSSSSSSLPDSLSPAVCLSSFALNSLSVLLDLLFPVHYPTSLHNDPRVLPEPVASLRASHCSPVFYLLDNGKRRNSSSISASSWTSACFSFLFCLAWFYLYGGNTA